MRTASLQSRPPYGSSRLLGSFHARIRLGNEQFAAGPKLDGSSDKDKGEKKESTSSTETKPTPPAYASILKDSKTISGLWTVYQKGNNLYWEIGSSDYSSEYIVLISISRGNLARRTSWAA